MTAVSSWIIVVGEMGDVIRLVIADDHPMVRRALAETLTKVLGTTTSITEVGSVTEAAAALDEQRTDLLLLDIDMPGMDGLRGVTGLRAKYPAVPILVVSANEDPSIVRQVVDLGASGFLPKSSPVSAIGEAVTAILRGDVWLPASEPYAGRGRLETGARVIGLTPQQRRVLELLSEGKLNKQIAFELDVTEATVKAHLSQIFKKLGVRSRTQALIAARRVYANARKGPNRS
jgi:DNA-binding NarL/FixJ family response regulator